MLPEHKLAARLQQPEHLLHRALYIPYCTQNLNTQHGIQTLLRNALCGQNLAVLHTTR
jgi:hypothetical protein